MNCSQIEFHGVGGNLMKATLRTSAALSLAVGKNTNIILFFLLGDLTARVQGF